MPKDYILAEKAIEAVLPYLCENCKIIIRNKISNLKNKITEMMGEFLEIT